MKRSVLVIAALPLLLLNGCGHSRGIYSNYRNVEELQLVRTLGVDASGEGLVLSAAAGRPQNGTPPAIVRRSVLSVPQGMDALQRRTPRGQLYFAHTQYLVLGQAFAETGAAGILDFVERDIRTRMGASLFVVRGGTAEALITGSGKDWDVSDVLTALKSEMDERGESHVFDVRETAVALSEYGAALVCALRPADTEGSVFALTPGLAAVPDGYGILRGGALIGFLDGAQSRAASLMLGKLGTVTQELPDGAGGKVTAELSCGAPEISLVRAADGALCLSVRAAPTVVIAALDTAREDVLDDASLEALAAESGVRLRRDLEAVLARSRAENADFLSLGRAIRAQGIDPGSLPSDWLRTLKVSVSVEPLVRHSYDMDAPAGTDGGGAA